MRQTEYGTVEATTDNEKAYLEWLELSGYKRADEVCVLSEGRYVGSTDWDEALREFCGDSPEHENCFDELRAFAEAIGDMGNV
jgi:hypothetical protein